MNISNEKTLKKSYVTPATTVVSVETESLLAGSGITGTVEDFKGWGNTLDTNPAKENSVSLWDEYEEQE